MGAVALLGVCLLAAPVIALAWARHVLETPLGPQEAPTLAVLDVQRGDTLRPVLNELAGRGVLAHPRLLYAFARYRHLTRLHSGRYEIGSDLSPRAILKVLNDGKVLYEDVTLAEGLNRWTVRAALAQAEWMSPDAFDRWCDDPDFLAHNQIPGPTCEGYLFPDTYKFARGVPPQGIFQKMFSAYKEAYKSVVHAHGFGPLALNEREFVTLAAIVEKETGVAAERPRIACVFYNRLRARPQWRLETDPTVIYAATLADPNFTGNLTRKLLHGLDSPYNTYRIFGLPRGPIANPGRAAMEAVAQPLLCKDYFFVANNAGEHIFCPTLRCHAEAVQTWQVQYFRRRSVAPLAPAPSASGHRRRGGRVGRGDHTGRSGRPGAVDAPLADQPAPVGDPGDSP